MVVVVLVMVVVDFGSVLFCNGDFLCEGCVIVQWDWAAAPWVQHPSHELQQASCELARAAVPIARSRAMGQQAPRWLLQLARCLLHPFPLREFVRRTKVPIAKNFVRQCARRTKTHNTRSEFLCNGCPSQTFLCDSVPVAQKLTTHVLSFCATGARRKNICATVCPSHKNFCAAGTRRTKIQIIFSRVFYLNFCTTGAPCTKVCATGGRRL